MKSFNGVSYIPDDVWLDSSNLQLFTDSAGSSKMGCRSFFFGTELSFLVAKCMAVLRDYERHHLFRNGPCYACIMFMGETVVT
jgi:hypothetical protein